MLANLLNRAPLRRALYVLIVAVVLTASLTVSYQLRFDFEVPVSAARHLPPTLLWMVPLQLLSLFLFGHFRGLLTFFRMPDLYRLFLALFVPSLGLLAWAYYQLELGVYYPRTVTPSRGIIALNFVLAFLGIGGLRVVLRLWREHWLTRVGKEEKRLKAVIYGAGETGSALLASNQMAKRLGLRVVAFLDDDRGKWGNSLHGIRIVGDLRRLSEIHRAVGLQRLIIAMPTAPTSRLVEISREATRLKLPTDTVPSIAELLTAKRTQAPVRSLNIADLLGRKVAELRTNEIRKLIQGKTVLVTGAGGTIGYELCRQIAFHSPQHLIAIERSEYLLFKTERCLVSEQAGNIVTPLVADIRNEKRMEQIFARYRPQLVFHAAAHKHVPMMEHQPWEAVTNNALGTKQLADLAARHGTQRFLLISTDKAINPTSVMGASKRLAEMFLQAKQETVDAHPCYMAVRFGNVLGSSGSVVPIFTEQIDKGGPVTVTHPDVTRYFMTVSEAVGLVLEACLMAKGGDIFVLDMGEPVKIVDLARRMIELRGLRPEVDIDIEFTGLRPGEKLFEELQHANEDFAKTDHPQIFRFSTTAPALAQIEAFLQEVADHHARTEASELKQRIKEMIPEYAPFVP